jgi:hypothetical protein
MEHRNQGLKRIPSPFGRWIFLLFLLAIPSFGLQAQDLWKAGFEQIYLSEEKDTVRLSFEHRGLRSPADAMNYARLLLAETLGERKLVFYPRYHNALLGRYDAQRGWAPVEENIRRDILSNTSTSEDYRLQFVLVPEFAARFGFFEQPVQEITNLILATQLYLLPGMSLQTGVLFPISNSLDQQEMNIRLAPSNLRYFHSWNQRNLLSMSMGLYYTNRYGLVGEYRRVNGNGNWSWGVETSYTGFYTLPTKGLYRAPLDQLVFLADVEFRLPFEPMASVRVSGGQFLNRDRGIRVDAIRQYGVVDIGFFAAKTQGGVNGGFQFAFPLFPGKLLRGKKVELRTTEEFRWEYGYNNEDVVGRNFRFGYPKLADWSRQYHRQLLEK